MALPPIFANSPLFRIFSGAPARPADQSQPAANTGGTSGGDPRDTVALSDEALKKLEDLQPSQISTDHARKAAGEVRTALENNPGQTLGSGDDPAA